MTNKTQIYEVFNSIQEGNLRRLKQLVELENASLEEKNVLGYTPLMDAAYLGQEEIVIYILDKIKKKYETTKQPKMIAHNLNAFSLDGKTALMIATLSNITTGILDALVKAGASPYLKDHENKTVFDYAPFAQDECVEDFWKYYLETDEIKAQQTLLQQSIPKINKNLNISHKNTNKVSPTTPKTVIKI